MKTKIYLLTFVALFSVNISSAQAILNYFNGAQSGADIQLTWQSSSEMNVDAYVIERSLDSVTFSAVGNVPGSGTAPSPVSYSYTDIFAFADTCYHYRLGGVMFDGNYFYCNTITVCYSSALTSVADITENLFSSAFPNPFSMQTVLTTSHLLNATLTVDNCLGQRVKQVENISGQSVTLFRDNLPNGMYFFLLREENKILAAGKLVVADK